jgi:hypothetical protein
MELKDFAINCIKKLRQIGCNIIVDDLTSIDYFFSDTELGLLTILGKHKYKISINGKLSKQEKQSLLLNTLYHELCHIIQFNEAFDNNIIDFNNKTKEIVCVSQNENLLINVIFGIDGSYHSDYWLQLAKEINQLLKINPPIVAWLNKKDLDLFLKETFVKISDKLKTPLVIVDRIISDISIEELDNYDFSTHQQAISEETLINKKVISLKEWLNAKYKGE